MPCYYRIVHLGNKRASFPQNNNFKIGDALQSPELSSRWNDHFAIEVQQYEGTVTCFNFCSNFFYVLKWHLNYEPALDSYQLIPFTNWPGGSDDWKTPTFL